ncbi:hypothetical protein VPH35_059942 [Triticum aestivum]|uniref:Uncharacterized protein n=2 Tax=Aegilops tauschii subsp. strangulata TaxID=200361 RepID=A0A453F0E9_AEGTS
MLLTDLQGWKICCLMYVASKQLDQVSGSVHVRFFVVYSLEHCYQTVSWRFISTHVPVINYSVNECLCPQLSGGIVVGYQNLHFNKHFLRYLFVLDFYLIQKPLI